MVRERERKRERERETSDTISGPGMGQVLKAWTTSLSCS